MLGLHGAKQLAGAAASCQNCAPARSVLRILGAIDNPFSVPSVLWRWRVERPPPGASLRWRVERPPNFARNRQPSQCSRRVVMLVRAASFEFCLESSIASLFTAPADAPAQSVLRIWLAIDNPLSGPCCASAS